jgi:3-oxoacyl-[acyl-carrier protein] reductase
MTASRVALVTGATGGMGRAIAAALARAGHALALHARDEAGLASLASGLGGEARVTTHAADLREPDRARGVVAEAERAHGRVDILVNNAGITRDGACWKLEPRDWDETLAVNLSAPFHLTAAVLPGMRDRQWGRVVNVGSVVGSLGVPGASAYAASKAGLLAFTRSVAKEVARRGVTENYVELGYFSTGMIETLGEKQLAWVLERIPAGELGHAEDVGELVAWLCTDAARYVTGQPIGVNGGFPG